MLKLIPLCCWTGITIAFYSGVLVSMLASTMPGIDTHTQYESSMMAMVVFGFGEMFGCFFAGYVIDKKGSQFAAIVDLASIFVTIIVTLLFLAENKFNYLAFAMAFLWGF
jgi:predicted MFS family arabinose efflux permease